MTSIPPEQNSAPQGRVPSESDWKNTWDGFDSQLEPLDVAYAYKTFSGKTNEEMQAQFYKSVLGCAEDLGYIPRIPFQYYILGFRDFVMRGNFAWLESSDAASSFLRLIHNTLLEKPLFILPQMPRLMPAVIHVSENQGLYDADLDIYGDFRNIRRAIEDLYSQRTESNGPGAL